MECITGSGQGLTASAAIANAAFMFSAELNGASLCRSTTRQQYNIIFYRRYVDNLFFIVANPESASNLLAYIHRSLDVYNGKVEDLCKESFGFLDYTYTFHRYENYSKLIPAPLLKLSSQFLSTQSAHPWQLHVAWPLAFLKTIHMRSDTIADYQYHQQQFISCLRSQGWDHNLLQHCALNSNYHLPFRHFRGRPRAPQDGLSWWLVLPFHPV